MANEVTSSCSGSYSDGTTTESFSSSGIVSSAAAQQPLHTKQQATTSAVLLNLGALTSVGLLWMKNLDAVNYVELLTATSAGSVVSKLLPGGPALQLPAGSNMQAPAIKANTASCWVEYMITP